MKKRMAVARLWLEVNSFSPLPTVLADFAAKEWTRGPKVLEIFAGTPTELGAVAAFAAARPDWDVTVLRCAAAEPGGPMDDDLFGEFLAELDRDLRAARWDAVYLSLHGALATRDRPTPDQDIVEVARTAVGGTPIGVSFDMHANLTPQLVALCTVAAGYKTLPHLDMHETAAKVLRLLDRTVAGVIRPVGALVRPGRVLHSHNMRTADGPMRELEAIAADLSQEPILDATPFGGFPWADSPFTGASAMVFADADASAAEKVAGSLAAAIDRLSGEFDIALPTPQQALATAFSAATGPVAVVECSDNTYSGGIADTTGLFAALAASRPERRAVFAYFYDPALVERAHALGEGARIEAALGGRIAPHFGAPVAFSGRIARLTEGRFVNHGPMLAGVEVRMGRTALLRDGNIDVIVTERRQPVNDLAYFEMHGIDVRAVQALCVKAKNHFRAAFRPVCAAMIDVDSPGPAALDLHSLPYRWAPRGDLPPAAGRMRA